MKYFEVVFTISPYTEVASDLLSGLIADLGFDSFVNIETGLQAYIPQTLFDESKLKDTIEAYPIHGTMIDYIINEPEDKNWNEEWEKNFFNPILIDNRLVIHSTFHTNYPEAEYEIIINPQMAFGTGHHETTGSILSFLLEADLTGKRVLDMGCGTSILGILASKRGAGEVVGIDIDDWCVRNSLENIALNACGNIEIKLGDALLLNSEAPFDVVIANINRNILLADMRAYVSRMKPGATLYISGFYTDDIPVLREEAEKLGLTYSDFRQKNNWAAVRFDML